MSHITVSTPATTTAGLDWINRQQYPLDQPDGQVLAAVVARVRADIAAQGCAVLPGFIQPEVLERLSAQVAALAPRAHYTHAEATVYGGVPDLAFPVEHPRRRLLRRENGFVAGDLIPAETSIRQLYHDRAFQHFLARCLDIPVIHEFADPLAQLVINVVQPGHLHAWHFDSNEFIVTLLTQQAEQGGEFQYAPGIRSPHDEHVEAVQAVLDGDTRTVHELALRPGDLQLFFGRYSLHRVARTVGQRDRHTAILAYSRQPGMVGQPAKTRQIFGRTLAQHDNPAGRWQRDDQLTD